jgi:hypothetical protein
MQDVPLSAGSRIHAGTKVVGHVIDVRPASATAGAKVTLQFDTLVISKRRIPMTTNLRALASMMAVRPECIVVAILKILFNLFTKPTSLPIVWWLGSADQYRFDVIQNIFRFDERLSGSDSQFAVLPNPFNTEP